jgi:AraC-like DNA-binding protein
MFSPATLRTRSTDPEPTTVAAWTRAIVRALGARGIDGEGVARAAGIDIRAAMHPRARVSMRANAELWHRAVHAVGDPGFGLVVPRFLSPAAFAPLGAVVMSSPTLREAIAHVASHADLIADGLRVAVEEDGARVQLVVSLGIAAAPAAAMDACLSLTVRLVRLLREDRNLAPLGVWMRRPPPASSAPFARCFRAPIEYGTARNGLDLARRDMDAPLPNGDARLNASLVAALLLAGRPAAGGFVGQVKDALRAQLAEGEPPQTAVARAVGVSARTLQRRLAGHGVSYQGVLDETRAELARGYLAAGWSVTETALELGFTSPSSLARAFRRWTGRAPTDADEA